jgi:hypothetical protein
MTRAPGSLGRSGIAHSGMEEWLLLPGRRNVRVTPLFGLPCQQTCQTHLLVTNCLLQMHQELGHKVHITYGQGEG